jgi:putative ABC transport system permease protein
MADGDRRSGEPRAEDAEAPPGARAAAMWRRYLHFWGPRVEADVDEELAFHVAMRVRDQMDRGMTEPEARAAVRARLGDLAAVRAACVAIDTRRHRRVHRARILDELRQDVRFGVRGMLRRKGWTAVGMVTLAIGIGANTAVFSVVHNLLLHPMDYPHADRLAVVYQQPTDARVTGVSVYLLPATPVLRAWRAGAYSFEDLEGYATGDAVLRVGGGPATTVHTATVQPGLARFAGKRPVVGRYFTQEDVRSRARVAVLSEGLWRSRYGGADSAVGSAVTLGRSVYTIVGVMPAAFQLPALLQDRTDVFLPLDVNDDELGVSMIGRLRPGVSPEQAARELDTLAARMPGTPKPLGYVAVVARPGRIVGFRDSLFMLSAAVVLVLIIACANVAHLLLARGAEREHEMAIRAAIGAGHGRLFRQAVTESLVLAFLGCLAGLAVGWAGLRALVALRPDSLSELRVAHMDATTLLVAVGLTVLTGVVFGLVGATQSARLASPEVLRIGAPTAAGAGRGRTRSLLVITEMALCTTLLVGAALLIRSVVHLQLADPGFDMDGLYTVSADLSATADSTGALRWAFYDRLQERLREVPGVRGVTLATTSPPGRNFLIGALEVEGQAPPARAATGYINTVGVRPGFFALMGMRFVEGGTFTDTTAAAGQVIVNAGMARRYWPRGSALGRRLRVVTRGSGRWLTIVGVVSDAATGGLRMERTEPVLYTPPASFFAPTLIARVTAPGAVLPVVRGIVREMNPAVPPVEMHAVAAAMAESIGTQRFTMLLLAVFAGIALVLAAVGLYGVMAYAVAQRAREIGVRIALGATAGRVARTVVGRGLVLVGAGMAIGLAGAHWGTRLVVSMLSGVEPGDPMSFAAAAGVLVLAGVLACLVPMLRAMRVDPVAAMRC